MKKVFTVLWICVLSGWTIVSANVQIKNNLVKIDYDPDRNVFTAVYLPNGQTFLKDGKLQDGIGSATVSDISDPTFGNGTSIKVNHTNGNISILSLYPNLPFIFYKSVIKNSAASEVLVNSLQQLTVCVSLQCHPDSVKAFGTGGIKIPEKNPGSYTFTAMVDPASRNGVVTAWLTHGRGSGLIFTDKINSLPQVKPRLDYGRLRLPGNASAETEIFIMGYFDDARLGLEKYADMLAQVYKIKLPEQLTGYCTWYADKNGRGGNEKTLPEIADYAVKNLVPYGFNFIQIDDYWQTGDLDNKPAKNFTAHRPDGPYPSGMKAIADKIKEKGIVAGLWFMPFSGNYKDPLFKDHQDWFVKKPDGTPFDNNWGGTVLDMTHPGARDYLAGVVSRISKEWGYKYFKMDGFYSGLAGKHLYTNDSYKKDSINDAIYFNPDKTNIEAFRDGVKLIRESAGDDVFFLGCTMAMNMRVFGASIGLVDAMRVGPDNGAAWRSLPRGPKSGTRFYFLNGRVWYNDPDPAYVRNSMPYNHARYITSWVGFSGQLSVNSDWLPIIDSTRLNLLQRTMPSHGLKPRPSDLFEKDIANVWLLTDTTKKTRRDAIGLFNHSEKDLQITETLERIGLPSGKYEMFDFWDNKLLEPVSGPLNLSVTAQDARIIALRPATELPQVISTSRHISQGMIDVLDESWNASKSVLSGKSKIVANDPYEIRVVARDKAATSVNVSKEDKKAGVTVSYKQDGPLVRITIKSPASRTVDWMCKF